MANESTSSKLQRAIMSIIANSHAPSSNSHRPASDSLSSLRLRRLERRAPPLQVQVGNEKRRRPLATVIVTVNAVAKRKNTNSSNYHLTLSMSKKNSLQSLTIQTNKAIKIASSSKPMRMRMAATARRLKRLSERSEIMARLWLRSMRYLTTLMRTSAKWYKPSARVAPQIKELLLNQISSFMIHRPPTKTYIHQLRRRRYKETRAVVIATGTLLISRTLSSIKMLALVARRVTMMRIARVAVPPRAVRAARRTWKSLWLSWPLQQTTSFPWTHSIRTLSAQWCNSETIYWLQHLRIRRWKFFTSNTDRMNNFHSRF